jgi:outer membrane protein OmpA-like peptidoglycan-associated protein
MAGRRDAQHVATVGGGPTDDTSALSGVTDGGIVAKYPPRGPRVFHLAPTHDGGITNTVVLDPWPTPTACVRLDHARFGFDSSFPRATLSTELDRLFALRPPDDPKGHKLAVFGHADPTGDEAYNKTLSGRRAKAIYALLTRQPELWDELHQGAFRGDRWGVESLYACLERLGYEPGPAQAKVTPKFHAAVRAFQKDRGLEPNGRTEKPTRVALFGGYMDALTAGHGGTPRAYTPKDFVGEGYEKGLRGAYQGCGERNPAMVLSAAEAKELDKPNRRDERNRVQAVNRRVLIFLYEPDDVRFMDVWECPAATEGPSACNKVAWSDKDQRLAPRDTRREIRRGGKTFGCQFYDFTARLSPCEALKGTVRLWIRDRTGRPYPAPVEYEVESVGLARRGRTDANGRLEEHDIPLERHTSVAWAPPDDNAHTDASSTDSNVTEPAPPPVSFLHRARVHLPVKDEPPERRKALWLRNLGYAADLRNPADALARFSFDYGVAETAKPDSADAHLREVHETGRPALPREARGGTSPNRPAPAQAATDEEPGRTVLRASVRPQPRNATYAAARLSTRFTDGRSFPKPSALPALRALLAFAKEHPTSQIAVLGFADESADDSDPNALAKARARAVAALIKGARDYFRAQFADGAEAATWGWEEVQWMLSALGVDGDPFYVGFVDGHGGIVTLRALHLFQLSAGLSLRNECDEETLDALIDAYLALLDRDWLDAERVVAVGCSSRHAPQTFGEDPKPLDGPIYADAKQPGYRRVEVFVAREAMEFPPALAGAAGVLGHEAYVTLCERVARDLTPREHVPFPIRVTDAYGALLGPNSLEVHFVRRADGVRGTRSLQLSGLGLAFWRDGAALCRAVVSAPTGEYTATFLTDVDEAGGVLIRTPWAATRRREARLDLAHRPDPLPVRATLVPSAIQWHNNNPPVVRALFDFSDLGEELDGAAVRLVVLDGGVPLGSHVLHSGGGPDSVAPVDERMEKGVLLYSADGRIGRTPYRRWFVSGIEPSSDVRVPSGGALLQLESPDSGLRVVGTLPLHHSDKNTRPGSILLRLLLLTPAAGLPRLTAIAEAHATLHADATERALALSRSASRGGRDA